MFLIENKLQELHDTFITPKNCFLKKPFLQEDQKEFDEIIASLRKETKTIEVKNAEKIADNNYQNYLWLSKIFLEEELTIRNLIYSLKMQVLSIEDYFITNTSYITMQEEYYTILKEYYFALLYFSSFLKKERRLTKKDIIIEEFYKERKTVIPNLIVQKGQFTNEEEILIYAIESQLSYETYYNLLNNFLIKEEGNKKIRQNICKSPKIWYHLLWKDIIVWKQE